jgi:hypothetical protein
MLDGSQASASESFSSGTSVLLQFTALRPSDRYAHQVSARALFNDSMSTESNCTPNATCAMEDQARRLCAHRACDARQSTCSQTIASFIFRPPNPCNSGISIPSSPSANLTQPHRVRAPNPHDPLRGSIQRPTHGPYQTAGRASISIPLYFCREFAECH